MEYYFSDRKFNIMGVARTTGKGEWLVSADSEVKTTDDRPAIALNLTIPFKTEQEQAIDEMAAENNFVLYQDEEGNGHQMVIASVTHDTLAHVHTVICTDAGNDLMNEVVGAYTADKAYTIADYIIRFTNDSGWEIGINEFPTDVRTLNWTDEDTSLSRIKSVAKDFDAVLSFGFVFVGTTAVKRVINIRHEETSDSLISFEMNKDINNIVKTVDIYDMETSVKAYGATPDGSNDPINLIGYQWKDPNGQFVLDQYGFLHDTIAVQKYSRLLSNSNPNPTQSDWNRVKTFESTTQATLLQAALADLKKYNHPNVNYEVDLANAPYVPLNQTVHIVDENQNLFLSAKVLSVERSRAGHYTKLTLGDYANEQPNLYSALKDMAVKIENIPKTVQYYPWIRYADDDKGTNMSAFPSGKKYMAVVYSNKSSVPSDNPADYAGKWALIQGKDGADGVPGAKGADGRTSYFHTAWANDVSGQSGFTVSGGDGKKYIGTYSDFTQADSTNPSDYNWALFKGDKGDTGPRGPQGPQGPQGVPGSKDVPYTYIQLGTPASPKKGDLWWHGTTLNDATALQYYNGTTWIDQSIQQAVLSIKKLQSIEVDSATINSPDINAPFNHIALSDANAGKFSSGITIMQSGHVNVSGSIEDDQGKADGHTLISDLGPSGFISRELTPDMAGDIQYANLQGGKLNLSTLISAENSATKKYIKSEFTSADNVTFFHVNTTPARNIDIDWAYIYYTRRGNLVTVNFQFHTIANQYNYLWLTDIRPGYTPYLTNKIVASCSNFSNPSSSSAIYSSTGRTLGWYGALTHDFGSYGGSVSYLTQDDYPTGDSFFA
ncbi:phage tail protein [Lacticaseibacillus rhamnosus]|uniref:phage tail protein n=1 Tax=Lacticaseibacillus rhamnosus TaxID=47715 RepID=UPI0007DEB1FB|nr:phage tail protein [Lacticaseibacillus rhamnosus]OAU60376.1 phage tail assembly [Lacticaseibacillus rhamnosus]